MILKMDVDYLILRGQHVGYFTGYINDLMRGEISFTPSCVDGSISFLVLGTTKDHVYVSNQDDLIYGRGCTFKNVTGWGAEIKAITIATTLENDYISIRLSCVAGIDVHGNLFFISDKVYVISTTTFCHGTNVSVRFTNDGRQVEVKIDDKPCKRYWANRKVEGVMASLVHGVHISSRVIREFIFSRQIVFTTSLYKIGKAAI